MDTSRVLSILLLIYVLLRFSHASTGPLIGKVSPSPAPNHSLSNNELSKNSHAKSVEPPPDSHDNGPLKSEEIKEKGGGKPVGEVPNGDKYQLENCDRSLQKCHAEDIVACLWHSEIANSKEWVVIVQNVGDYTLNVNVTVPASVMIDAKMLNLSKHGTRKVKVSAGATKALKIVLNAGKGDCILQIGTGLSPSDWTEHFPLYTKQFTAVYGAYFLLFTLIIAGAVRGYCKLRKHGSRDGDGVRYQQLEMGAQMQPSTEIVEASPANGWEESWDDEWDEEEARTRPSTIANPNGNVSSNGLSPASADKKNDWDIDWDD